MRGRRGAGQRDIRGSSYSTCPINMLALREMEFCHQRVLSRKVTQPPCVLAGSLWFLCREQTEREEE